DGVQAHAGNIVLRNLFLTAAVPVGVSSKALALQGVIGNNTGASDSLVGVTADNTPFKSATSSVTVAPGTPVMLGTDGLRLTVSNLPTGVLPGSLVSLTFAFQQAGQVTVAVPVYTLPSREPGAEPSAKCNFPP